MCAHILMHKSTFMPLAHLCEHNSSQFFCSKLVFYKIKDSADFFVCNFPTLFCRKFAGRPVADPRYFFGFSHTFFGVKIKVSADRFFVVVGIPTLFGRFTARAVANSRYFIGFLRLKIQRMQNAPPYREKKKKKKTGKPRLNLTRSLQQGNSR